MRKFDYYFVHHCHNVVVFLEWRQHFKQSFIVLSVTFLTEVNCNLYPYFQNTSEL